MIIVIEKSIDRIQLVNREICLDVLSRSGMEVIDSVILIFSENYNLSTDLSSNRTKVFKTLLKGQIEIDYEKSVLRWKLRLGGIIFKTLLIFVLVLLVLPVLYDINYWVSMVVCSFLGFLMFIFSRISLYEKVNRLTAMVTA